MLVLLNHAVTVKLRREEAALLPALVMTCLTKTNLPSDTKEGVAISRATQAKSKVRSRKSQATLGGEP